MQGIHFDSGDIDSFPLHPRAILQGFARLVYADSRRLSFSRENS